MFTHAARVAPERTVTRPVLPSCPSVGGYGKPMMGKTYSEKLKDPRWQKKRLEALSRDRWACSCCGDGTKTLHVHHTYYVSGREPWEYPSGALESLCETCHDEQPGYGSTIIDRLVTAMEIARSGVAATPEQAEAARLIQLAVCAWLDVVDVGTPTSLWLDRIEKSAASLREMASKKSEAGLTE